MPARDEMTTDERRKYVKLVSDSADKWAQRIYHLLCMVTLNRLECNRHNYVLRGTHRLHDECKPSKHALHWPKASLADLVKEFCRNTHET